MTLLTRYEILSKKPPTLTLPILEWGGEVRVRGLTLAERIEFESVIDDDKFWRCRLVAYAVVDDEDRNLFTLDDIQELAKVHWPVIILISDAVSALSKLNKVQVQQAAENLAPGQPGASPTA